MVEVQSTLFQRIGSALFLGSTSFLITIVNKIVLTTFNFPSFLFLGLGQLTASVILLLTARMFKWIEFPSITENTLKEICPLPLIFLGNMVFGLGGTQSLSLPMFTALRNISLFLTMILEMKLIGSKPGWVIQASVYIMIAGAFVAAMDDLSFKLEGYILIMITNVLTALYQVYIKKKLVSGSMNQYGLMFYNSLFSIIPAIIATSVAGDFKEIKTYSEWYNPWFLSCFILSCVMGFLLAFSTFLCTSYNSALTVAVVGSIKNILVTFIGVFVGEDYIFSIVNSVGLSISTLASVLYSFALVMTGDTKHNENTEQSAKNDDIVPEPIQDLEIGGNVNVPRNIDHTSDQDNVIEREGRDKFESSENKEDPLKNDDIVPETKRDEVGIASEGPIQVKHNEQSSDKVNVNEEECRIEFECSLSSAESIDKDQEPDHITQTYL